MLQQDKLALNAIRVLSIDAIQKANSGHPGIVLGATPMLYELYAHHMLVDPDHPNWLNRDRFVLSAGHGSMMLYSLLHMMGYGIGMEDLKQFRQWGSLTPGHPEYRHTPGVDATSGPLGQGVAMAVGMAMAEAHLAAVFNKPGYALFDHYTYCLAGDGCMMEGVASEAASFAGTQKLHKLIVLYDRNQITIEGSTDAAFAEDVGARYEAYGWDVSHVEDGEDIDAVGSAIEAAKGTDKPSLIIVKTQIGMHSPLAGQAKTHGSPLGEENIAAVKQALGWEYEPFCAPEEDVYKRQEKTSPYEFYQYFRNVEDASVENCLALLTYLPMEEVRRLGALRDSEINIAKEVLAYEVTKLIHGEEEADKAQQAARALFGGGDDLENMPTTYVTEEELKENPKIIDLMVLAKICKSKGEARRLIQGGGVSVDDVKIEDVLQDADQDKIAQDGIIIKKGKKVFHRIRLHG